MRIPIAMGNGSPMRNGDHPSLCKGTLQKSPGSPLVTKHSFDLLAHCRGWWQRAESCQNVLFFFPSQGTIRPSEALDSPGIVAVGCFVGVDIGSWHLTRK